MKRTIHIHIETREVLAMRVSQKVDRAGVSEVSPIKRLLARLASLLRKKTRTLLPIVCLLFCASALVAAQDEIWTIAKPPQEPVVAEGSFHVYALDAHALAVALNRAARESGGGAPKDTVIPLPLPSGTFVSMPMSQTL